MRFNLFINAVCCAALAGMSACCVMNKLDNSPHTIILKPDGTGTPVTIAITKGPDWSQRMQAGPFVFNILPQIVIWTETMDGRLLKTLYITGADYKKFNHAGKGKKGAAFYAECFPVWAGRMKSAGQSLPSKEAPYTDAVTSATPMSSFSVRSIVPSDTAPYSIFCEINKSGDVNETYTKENNDWVGQPSLIYRVTTAPGGPKGPLKMELAGHGGRLRDNPAIYPDVSGFTTALRQVEAIVVNFE